MSLKTKVSGLRDVMQFDNRIQLLLSRTLFQNCPLDVYCLKGRQILVDHSAGDENGTRAAITSPMYKHFLPLMQLPECVNVLDIGANGGGFPLMLELNGRRINKIACVELNPNTFSRLRFNLERNISGEIVPLNAAVCGEAQEFELNLGMGGTADNIYQKSVNQGQKTYRIQGMTFDHLYQSVFGDEPVHICKMDIERAEYDVFELPYHQYIARCAYLVIEIHPRPDKSKQVVIDELLRLGFEERTGSEKGHEDVYLFANTRLVK